MRSHFSKWLFSIQTLYCFHEQTSPRHEAAAVKSALIESQGIFFSQIDTGDLTDFQQYLLLNTSIGVRRKSITNMFASSLGFNLSCKDSFLNPCLLGNRILCLS